MIAGGTYLANGQNLLEAAKITGKAGDKVTINGKEFTYYDKAADGQTDLKTAGFYAEQPSVADKDSATPAYASTDAIAALKSATISVGTKSITAIVSHQSETVRSSGAFPGYQSCGSAIRN